MTQEQIYLQGFIEKCAAEGIDGEELVKQANPLRWLKKYLKSITGETAEKAETLYEKARNAPRMDVEEYSPVFADSQMDRLDKYFSGRRAQRRNDTLDARQDKLFELALEALENKKRDRIAGLVYPALGVGALGTGAALLSGDEKEAADKDFLVGFIEKCAQQGFLGPGVGEAAIRQGWNPDEEAFNQWQQRTGGIQRMVDNPEDVSRLWAYLAQIVPGGGFLHGAINTPEDTGLGGRALEGLKSTGAQVAGGVGGGVGGLIGGAGLGALVSALTKNKVNLTGALGTGGALAGTIAGGAEATHAARG
jgi:hypothetical protein